MNVPEIKNSQLTADKLPLISGQDIRGLMSASENPKQHNAFNAAELGMLAHLYRGEMYRSKIWRTRLDATTNWAVATTGIALSVAFSSPGNSPLPSFSSP